MTVSEPDDGEQGVFCKWFVKDELKAAYFQTEELMVPHSSAPIVV